VDDTAAGSPCAQHGPAEGHACLGKRVQGMVCKTLDEEEVNPHKVRYYLERRDPEFKKKMVEVLCVYREVKIIKETAAAAKQKPRDAVAIISYDEKPGIQAIATTASDLPPEPGTHATFARDHEYKRHGTVSLLAGIDLLTRKVHALVKGRHRSREFIEFLELLDTAYPADTAINLILDNHSAHISKETRAWLADQPAGRFEFTFTPKHGSLAQPHRGLFSKLARSASATFVSPPNRNSRIASSLRWTISARIPWLTVGPTNSIEPCDMIRISETMSYYSVEHHVDIRDSHPKVTATDFTSYARRRS
jgi:transposase